MANKRIDEMTGFGTLPAEGDMYLAYQSTDRKLALSLIINKIDTDVGTEASARAAADASEATARANADTTLQANIDAEATSRTNADNTLQANIDAEATSRTNADNTLQANIDALKLMTAVDITANHQLLGTDNLKYLSCIIGAGGTVTIPLEATESITIGSVVTVRNNDTVDLTIAAEGGVTTYGGLTIPSYETRVLYKRKQDEWDII